MNTFIFDRFEFDRDKLEVSFYYKHSKPQLNFAETVTFSKQDLVDYDDNRLQAAFELLFYLCGISYFKAFPTTEIRFNSAKPNSKQEAFLRKIYTEGLCEMMFENDLKLKDMPFQGAAEYNFKDISMADFAYASDLVLCLQSGGKDSLLTATLMYKDGINFQPFNMPYGKSYPEILNSFKKPVRLVNRQFDITNIKLAMQLGGLNGHVPVTYITTAIAIADAILHGERWVILSIGQEGNEPHEFIGNMPVNHQWSKTWYAERMMSDYVAQFIDDGMVVGSPIRKYSELKVAEMFVRECWDKYGSEFSSCNLANYKQNTENVKLKWCGNCPKCANSFLLFSPFVEPKELISVIGSDMYKNEDMTNIFKGLLGIDGYMKPFECVGEVDELRKAYHMAQNNWGGRISKLSFEVPDSNFDLNKTYDYNKFFDKL